MSDIIKQSLQKIMANYLTAKTESFKEHSLEKFIRQEVPSRFYSLPFIDQKQYVIKTSVGRENWANIPSIAIMNKDVATSTKEGYYISYLFSEDMTRLYLTIAQNVTKIKKEKMKYINNEIRDLLIDEGLRSKDENIYLGESNQAKEYSEAVVINIPYLLNELPPEKKLQLDLRKLMKVYETCIERNKEQRSLGTKNNRFVDYIVRAVSALGGQAKLAEIYSYFKKEFPERISHYTDGTSRIRNQIYLHSSDADIFKGKPGDEFDLFYSVKGKGKGVWGLRNSKLSKTKQIYEEHTDYETSQPKMINHIHSYIKSRGFFYTKEEIINLVLSLRTKPFVILSGISGTGKTKLVQLFAESIGATEENGQMKLIPVRPDWSDGSDLLGYVDIRGDFQEGPLTKIIRAANNNPMKPYIALLDEMNLARVEHYFSDILSVIESRRWNNGDIISSPLLTEDSVGFTLYLPSNLYIVGTVNMDETTYSFSKKVLDRANTIELNRIELDNLTFLNELKEKSPLNISQENLASEYLHLKDVYFQYKDLINKAINELIKINNVLESINAHVGYRVRDEICFYLAYNAETNLLSYNKALDYCILQKILPRIYGSDYRIDNVLRELYSIFTSRQYDDTLTEIKRDLEVAKYPNSAKKTVEMLRRLEDGFTSFWI